MNKALVIGSAAVAAVVVAIMLVSFPTKPVPIQSPTQTNATGMQVVASHLQIPWAIDFADDERIFFTERVGKVRVIDHGKLIDEPIFAREVARSGEAGMLGLALDPNFKQNGYIYVYYTYVDENGNLWNKVSKLVKSESKGYGEQVLIDKIPAASIHDGGRIKFGPDGKLYVTTGDSANPTLAQDLTSLAGKILRINPDGSTPADNPFPNSLVYSYGHRNPQGLDWDPLTGKLVETEHGPSGEKGFAHDEVNVVEPGKNYGWPNVVGKANDPRYVDPIIDTGDVTWAPSGASFYHADKIPEWKDKFFIATLRGNHIRILQLDTEANKVISSEAIFQGTYGRLRDVAQGPDGYLYILTSNTDGRGLPAPDDDKILRITNVG